MKLENIDDGNEPLLDEPQTDSLADNFELFENLIRTLRVNPQFPPDIFGSVCMYKGLNVGKDEKGNQYYADPFFLID